MGAVPTILMGDPSYFWIRSGGNPHTRTRWGFRKKVNLPRAKKQWHTLARLLTDLGVQILVLPPSRENPGSVFSANAGFLYPKKRGAVPIFYLANLSPGRAGEKTLYRDFLSCLGFALSEIPYPLEGEADFIQTGSGFLFTSGEILKKRLVPCWGFPPYKRRYGFRSDLRNRDFLKHLAGDENVFPLRLVDERFYHGDTVLAPFGPQKEFLLAYLPALSKESQKMLLDLFKGWLIPLEKEDAFCFAANGFQVETEKALHFVLQEGVSNTLIQAIERRGVKVLPVDVSEFSEKGGGSVKCLLCELGHVDLEGEAFSEEVKRFWRERAYTRLYPV